MNENLTDITLLLDRSGSMQMIKSDVVGGIQTFIEEQKKAEGDANFTLIQFDDVNPYEVIVKSKPIKQVKDFKSENFVPRGCTPLFDALGKAIVKTGERLSEISEEQRPSKVIFVVFTDGYENASREYNGPQLKEMVKHQNEKYNWQFLFLGANIDAIAAAGNIGINMSTTANVGAANVAKSYQVMSSNVAQYRKSGDAVSLNYTDDQRNQLK